MSSGNKLLFVLVFVLLGGAAACQGAATEQASEAPVVGLANPSAVYCEGLGYSTENVIRNGGEDADCIFPDGSRCAAWDFLAGRCGQSFSYCEMQGYEILEGEGNIGTCQFPDGSTCDEYLYFSGDCSPGDNPGAIVEEPVEIQDFVQARDYMADYFSSQYGIEQTDPWLEQDITPDNAVASTTVRYVSGPLTIVISAPVSAPYASLYTIEEASYLVNGFYWEGALSFEGYITETLAIPPGTVLNEEQARDAVMDYLTSTYGYSVEDAWIDQGISQTEMASAKRLFTAGPWAVEVEFEPAAPIVSSYRVTVDNLSEVIRWEGEISYQGEIVEINFTRGD
jgi:putative hemolysin